MKKFNKILSLLVVFAMVLTMLPASVLAVENNDSGITVERLDNISANLMKPGSEIEENETHYNDSDIVRVMIVLEGDPAISLMHSVEDALSDGSAVAEQREYLIDMQHTVSDAISAALGSKLDVQWNLTLVANAISANVEYGQIDTIAGVSGVKGVYLEARYLPLKADTSNIISQEMTGASAAQNSGYTGAGSRVAVIDTGTDTDHQSFSGAAFEYALAELAEKNGMSFDEYVASLNLLTVEEIAEVLDQLHIYSRHEGELSAGDLYINSKLPFNYNYVDLNLNMDHEDTGNEHGSHVAGISTANRYIDCAKVYDFDASGSFDMDDILAVAAFINGSAKSINNVDYADVSGNGTLTTYDLHLMLDALEDQETNGAHYISAYDSVRVTGVAPDAQLLTMKVFGENGGAYASDYMAAVEDSIVLGCDVVNLSLGAPYPGFSSSHTGEWDAFIDGIMERVGEAGIVMSVAAGNSGSWAYYSNNGVGMMYTDEAGTYTTGEPATYKNSLSVASADNIVSMSALQVYFLGADGEKVALAPYGAVLDEDFTLSSWTVLDEIDPNYASTDYELVFLGDPTNLFNGLEQKDETIYAGSMADFAGYDFTGKVVLIARGTYTFTDKHSNAALAGAAAVVIYNNVPGAIQPNITGTTNPEIPCAGISLEEAYALYTSFALNEDGLYAGTLSVTKRLHADLGDASEYPAMSSFSSWGTTGGLNIKPEITAPGGSIYSVNGDGTTGDQYEIMSGTSMAAPHLSGLTALLTQYFRENGILDKTGLTSRVLAHSLLMSTAEPLIEETTGVEYSIRNQGAGLANIQNAINSNAYILVTGQEDGKVKAELGDGTADRLVEFTITNFGDSALTYELSASILTTGTAIDGYGFTYSTDGMTALDADVTFSADSVTVEAGETVTVTAIISIPEAVAAEMEEIGYTNGFYIEGFLYINPIADSEGVMDAAHSIPLLGWYGNWNAPSMFDGGDFFDYAYGTLERPSHIASYTKNVLTWEPTGYGSGLYYTGNIYGEFTGEGIVGDQRYIEARNAISNLPTAQWSLYAIFPTLIRNVGDFKIEVTDVNTGEVYYCDDYEQYDDTMTASFFYTSYGEWYDCTGDYGIGLGDWNFTDANGDPLPDGTQVEISLICVPEYFVENGVVDWDNIELTEGNKLSYRFTIDNTAPALVDDSLVYDAETNVLSFTVQDENYVAAVVLLNGSASEAIDFYYPDMDEEQRGQAVTGSVNLGDYAGKKIAVAVCDYAGNESYYAINLGGEGASYGDLIGFQPDPDGYPGSWVAFDTNVNANETALFAGTADFICAEYVNGLIYAQDETGKFYGIPYEDMLADSVNLEACYITTLEFIYQDLAYNYCDGKLYGITTYEDSDGYPTTELNEITLSSAWGYNDSWQYVELPPYQEENITQRGGLYGLSLAISDDTIYVLGLNATEEYDEEYNVTVTLSETAHLWSLPMEYDEYEEAWMPGYRMTDLGDTDLEMDYLQSMTWDHNTETLYWARFYPVNWYTLSSELVKFSFNEDGTPVGEMVETTIVDEWGDTYVEEVYHITTEVVGTLSGETCALMAPLGAEAAAKEEHLNVPEFDSSVPGTPTLSAHTLTLNMNGTATLECFFDPWYSAHKEVVWTSSDETVAIVDQNGNITAVGDGSCEITVTNAEDENLTDTCAVTVASLTLDIEGIISYSSGGITSITDSKLYNFSMTDGESSLEFGNAIYAPEEFMGYGLNIGSAIYAKGSIWACEVGNAGMIYEIDPVTGAIRDVLSPIDGDMMFGLAYSEATGMFTGIMNFYLYVDLPMTHEAEEEMLGSYDEELHQHTWHRFNLADHLAATAGNFVTGETMQGSVGEIVFCGITNIENTDNTMYMLEQDAFGNYFFAQYTPATTYVILDNVGRLWYIDEIINMTAEVNEEYGSVIYMDDLGSCIEYYPECMENSGIFSVSYQVDETTELHNVFIIREIEETPLTDMFRAGTMPRITYHFSDIYYAGRTEDMENMYGDIVPGAPVFYLSLYDYWNGGAENLLYLYVGGVATGEQELGANWTYVDVKTPGSLYELGGTGTGNIIATITYATPYSNEMGLPPIEMPTFEEEEYEDWSYTPANKETFVGFFRVENTVVPALPPVSVDPSNPIAACVNRLG